MLFESRQKRHRLIEMLLGLIPELIIASALAYTTGSGIASVVVFFVLLHILYFVIWIKNLIWVWLIFYLWGRRVRVQETFNVLRSSRYPEPDDYHLDAEHYIRAVAENETLPSKLRIEAAVQLGAIGAFLISGRFMEGLQVLIVFEDAIQLYKHDWLAARLNNSSS